MGSSTIGVVLVLLVIHLSPSVLSRTFPQLPSDDQEFKFTSEDGGEESSTKNVSSLWEEATAAGDDGELRSWPFYGDQGNTNGSSSSSSVSGCFQDGGLAGCLKKLVELLFGTTHGALELTDKEDEQLQQINGSLTEGSTPRKKPKGTSLSTVVWLLLLSKTTTMPLALLILKALLMSSVSLAVALLQAAALAGKNLRPSTGRGENQEHQLAAQEHQMAYLAQ